MLYDHYDALAAEATGLLARYDSGHHTCGTTHTLCGPCRLDGEPEPRRRVTLAFECAALWHGQAGDEDRLAHAAAEFVDSYLADSAGR